MDLPEVQRVSLEALTRQDGYDGSVSARAQMVRPLAATAWEFAKQAGA